MELENLNKTYPRVMMVSDSPITKKNPGNKRVVWAYNPKLLYAYCTMPVESVEELNKMYQNMPDGMGVAPGLSGFWMYAKDYEPEELVRLTIEEIAEKFAIKPENVKIVQ